MVSNPIVDGLVVVLGIGDVLVHLRRVERLSGAVPGTHVNARREGTRKDLASGLDVDVLRRGGRARVEVRVMRGELAAEG